MGGEAMFTKVKANLKNRGYEVNVFDTAMEAAAYLDLQIDGQKVGFGGSVTLKEMGLYEKLSRHNEVIWHNRIAKGVSDKEIRMEARTANIYVSSVNGLAETGEIINIDGTGNRVASIFYGHEKVYLVIGKNKLAKDYEDALWRARNIASPLNAKRLGAKTPCAVNADRCYDCNSPQRICRGLLVLWEKPISTDIEIILVKEDLGY
ncbi:MAG: lactate utilization protein [Firmicutes bacterium]|nr:lactate utilization protein [Bacillota bacterium]